MIKSPRCPSRTSTNRHNSIFAGLTIGSPRRDPTTSWILFMSIWTSVKLQVGSTPKAELNRVNYPLFLELYLKPRDMRDWKCLVPTAVMGVRIYLLLRKTVCRAYFRPGGVTDAPTQQANLFRDIQWGVLCALKRPSVKFETGILSLMHGLTRPSVIQRMVTDTCRNKVPAEPRRRVLHSPSSRYKIFFLLRISHRVGRGVMTLGA